VACSILAVLSSCAGRGVVLESHRVPPGGGAGGTAATSSDGGGGTSIIDGGPDAPTSREVFPASGSQVEAIGWAAGGTIFAFDEYRDRKHDVSCSLQVAEDGIRRCLPDLGYQVVFTDPGCEHPVGRVPQRSCSTDSDQRKYMAYAKSPAAECGARVHIVSVGDATAEPSETYALGGIPPECHLVEGSPSGVFDFYGTVPVDPTEWVAYQREVVPLSSNVGVEVWHGKDGSRIIGDFEILPSHIPCSPFASSGQLIGNNPSYCVPLARGRDARDYFTDPTCTTFVTNRNRCDPPVISERTLLDTCESFRFAELGKERSPGSIFWKVPGELRGLSPADAPCEGAAATWLETENARYFEIGPDIDPSRYPALKEKWTGEGPILGHSWVGDGRSGQPCHVTKSGGKSYCVTSVGYSVSADLFADANCTRPLFWSGAPSPCEGAPEVPKWAIPGPAADCQLFDPLRPLRPILAPYRGAIYQQNVPSSSKCSLTPDPVIGDTDFYELGDPIDPASVFTEVTTLAY
jgi:hypothetical protein